MLTLSERRKKVLEDICMKEGLDFQCENIDEIFNWPKDIDLEDLA